MPWELAVSWEPNAPGAVLITSDYGRTLLALNAHLDDADQRCVVLVWQSVWASIGQPNDEARGGHRLYGVGLAEVLWGGYVEHSSLIADLARQDNVAFPGQGYRSPATLTHSVVAMKEGVVEVIGAKPRVTRVGGSTASAALAALNG